MKATILEAPGRWLPAQVDEPRAPEPGEALVRIRKVGVCGTDFHAFRGEQPFFSYPRILGHELSVEIVALGSPERGLAPGMRCAVEPYFNCGHCPTCRRGKTNCCVNLKVFGVHIDGGMREMALVPLAKLHPSSTLSFEQLALVEPLSIGAHAVSRGVPSRDEHVLIVGAGPIGLAVTQFTLLTGADVMVMDISPQRLAFCQRLYPQVTCLDGRADPLVALQAAMGDDLPTLVFDATGSRQSMQNAFQYVAYGGRLIFVGLFQGDITFHDPHFHQRELTIYSSRNATAADFRHVMSSLETGQINDMAWITHRATSEDMTEAFAHWLDPASGVIKAMIEW
jgi:2-desacetyl-2-hydroxyethyl bacteriochlorophyllide A dehydrogenase